MSEYEILSKKIKDAIDTSNAHFEKKSLEWYFGSYLDKEESKNKATTKCVFIIRLRGFNSHNLNFLVLSIVCVFTSLSSLFGGSVADLRGWHCRPQAGFLRSPYS